MIIRRTIKQILSSLMLIFATLSFGPIYADNAQCSVTRSEIPLGYSSSSVVYAEVFVDNRCSPYVLIHLNGPIDRAAVSAMGKAAIEGALAGIHGDHIQYFLNSLGGDLDASYFRALAMRTSTTIVPSGAECASACVLLFAAGGYRIIAPDARLGIHSAYFSNTGSSSILDNVRVADFLRSNGVNYAAFLELANTTPGNEIIWLNARDAISLGFADHISD